MHIALLINVRRKARNSNFDKTVHPLVLMNEAHWYLSKNTLAHIITLSHMNWYFHSEFIVVDCTRINKQIYVIGSLIDNEKPVLFYQ